MKFCYNDGGRAEAGYKGKAGDCVVRSIAIVTGLPYQEVYTALTAINHNTRVRGKKGTASAREGVFTHGVNFKRYMKSLGFRWVPTMFVGQGCKVHLVDGELPMGKLIVAVSKHYTAVIDGVIHDTHNPQRNTLIVENGVRRIAHRCVYGYWKKD